MTLEHNAQDTMYNVQDTYTDTQALTTDRNFRLDAQNNTCYTCLIHDPRQSHLTGWFTT